MFERLRALFAPSKQRAPVQALGSYSFGWSSINGVSAMQGDWQLGSWQRNLDPEQRQNILAFSAVYACITIIASDIAKLPVNIWRDKAKGGRDLLRTNPIQRLLRKPNDYQTRYDFVFMWVFSKLLTGNVYVLQRRDARNVITELHILDPRTTVPVMSPTGDIFYKVKANPIAGIFEDVTIPARRIIHDRHNPLGHPLIGVTPLFAAATSAIAGLTIQDNSASFFANMSRTSGVLSAPGKISKETADRLKEQWESNFTRGKFGRTAVLGDGLEWKSMTINAVDAQLIEQLKWTTEDVARAFRVPTYMLGDLTKVTYKNSEQLARQYYSGCLQSHIECIEMRLDEAFEFNPNTYTEFDLDVLLRTEMDVRFTAYKTAIQAGFMTLNEARAKEGDAPVEGGDEPLIQSQYVPLSKLGEKEAPKVLPQAGDDPPTPTASEDDNTTPAPAGAEGE